MSIWYPGLLINYILQLLSGHAPPVEPPGGVPDNPSVPAPPLLHDFNPQHDFEKPQLWKYRVDKSHDIWIAENYQDYIIPYNDIVGYFIDHIKFEEEGDTYLVVRYKSNDWKVTVNYRTDTARLCRESGQNDTDCYNSMDFWINPDYYIWNNFEGDCEDYALLYGSVFERLNIPYMIVSGYIDGNILDWWIEFKYKGKVYLGQVNRYGNRYGSTMGPIDHTKYRPFEMFNKSTGIQPYREWYKDYQSNPKAILVG